MLLAVVTSNASFMLYFWHLSSDDVACLVSVVFGLACPVGGVGVIAIEGKTWAQVYVDRRAVPNGNKLAPDPISP